MKFEPADDIEQRHDEAVAQLPRAILLLRKIAQLRANRTSAMATRMKVGRNDPCPCGSGKKYKRCWRVELTTTAFTHSKSSPPFW